MKRASALQWPALAQLLVLCAATSLVGAAKSQLHILVSPVKAWGESLAGQVASTAEHIEWRGSRGRFLPRRLAGSDAGTTILFVDPKHLEAGVEEVVQKACVWQGLPSTSEACVSAALGGLTNRLRQLLLHVKEDYDPAQTPSIWFVAPDVDALLSQLNTTDIKGPNHLAAAAALLQRRLTALLAARYVVWQQLAEKLGFTFHVRAPDSVPVQKTPILNRTASDIAKYLAFNLGNSTAGYPVGQHHLDFKDGFSERLSVQDTAWPFPYLSGLAAANSKANTSGPWQVVAPNQASGMRPLVYSYANCAFFDMATNFLLAAKAAGLHDTYVIPTDSALEERLRAEGLGPHVLPDMAAFVQQEGKGQHFMWWNSPAYNADLIRRPFYVKAFLTAGIPFIFSDIDTAFLKNPLPHIPWDQTLVAQNDSMKAGIFDLCGCLMVLKPELGAVRLIDEFTLMYKDNIQMKDQRVMTSVVQREARRRQPAFPLKVHVLPQPLFPAGWMIRTPPVNATDYVWAHANRVHSHQSKVRSLKNAGAWFAQRSERSCKKPAPKI